jgi:CheY-like chemotaxis protein
MNTAEMLTDLGHSVLEAGSAKEALMLAQKSFDLLVTDIGLPDLSGYELVRELGNAGRVFKVIFASGQSRQIEETLPGAFLVTKPYSQEDLTNAIKEIFRQ